MATDDDYSRGTATMVKASARVRAPGVADASRRVNRREPPCQPPRGKPSAQRRTTTTTHHRTPVPPRSTPWRPARPLHRAERHGAQRQRKTQPPPTPTATTNRPPTATHEQTTRQQQPPPASGLIISRNLSARPPRGPSADATAATTATTTDGRSVLTGRVRGSARLCSLSTEMIEFRSGRLWMAS